MTGNLHPEKNIPRSYHNLTPSWVNYIWSPISMRNSFLLNSRFFFKWPDLIGKTCDVNIFNNLILGYLQNLGLAWLDEVSSIETHFNFSVRWKFQANLFELIIHTVDGSEILNNHLGWCWNPINNGINYQPQLVQDFSHQQYHSSSKEGKFTTVDGRNPACTSWGW